MQLPHDVDRLVDSPVLVFGSPPPAGRDLDLLARPAELDVISEWLRRQGFVERSGEWVRFRDCGVESLDLVPVAAWGLSGEDAVEQLFADARPIPGFEHLFRPAPWHLLLALARRTVEGDGRLAAKHRSRIDAAVAEDAGAWEAARSAAPAWHAQRALAALKRAYETYARVSLAERGAALAEWPYAVGRTPARARVRGLLEAQRGRRRKRGQLISFSGLDGAGKSSQAEALQAGLERLGWEASIQWTRLEWTTLWENPWLGRLGLPARAALGALEGVRGRRAAAAGSAAVAAPLTPQEIRRRSDVVANVWATVIALAHASAQRRETRPYLRRGAVVICDRYTLDSAAHLRFRYGEQRPFRLQIRLVERLSPRPLRAYFLDIPGESAYARKAEQYSLDDLTRQARLYRDEAERLGVRTLDGERPREELCAEIAEDVWRALG